MALRFSKVVLRAVEKSRKEERKREKCVYEFLICVLFPPQCRGHFVNNHFKYKLMSSESVDDMVMTIKRFLRRGHFGNNYVITYVKKK